ncbi:hypothetical protein QZH41_017874 [Actinostola sp. cb2023]|nr:hypothetical protein QZH41_017874 [Actinostola sp. cb2023]
MTAITRAAWFSAVSCGNERELRYLIDAGADINVIDNVGDTALMLAAENGKEEVARVLIDAGADINVTNNYGDTALMLAAENGKEEVIALIDAGADVNVTNNDGYTALMLAAEKGKDEVVRALMKAGADINVTNKYGYTALMIAAGNGKKEVARALIDGGADVNVANNDGDTALILTAENGKEEVARALIDAGADVNVTNNYGKTALLLFAAQYGKEQVARALIDAGADVSATDLEGQTAIFGAAKYGHEAVTRVLIDDGRASVNARDAYEVFALANALIEVACQENHAKLESLLDTICKDKSTRTYWKSTVVKKMLKSRSDNVQATAALRYCCINIKELHDRESAKSDGPDSEAKSDSRREIKSIDGEEMKKPRNDHSKDHSATSSVHWEIAKQLRFHGADYKLCKDIARNYPELNELLTNEIDNNHVPMIIPWTSNSTTHKAKLARVARRQIYDTVGTYWYHQETIGSGSFGHVFAGINENDGREVAIKKIDKSLMVRREDKREIENLTALADCQQVVRYIYFDDNDRSFAFIVLELMEGHLDDYFESASFDVHESTPLCKDVAMGLKYLHAHKPKPILHRDLKPGNILYKTSPKLCLKIADFGLSSPIDGASKTTVLGTNVGTRCWVAPEVTKSTNHQHSMSSDVFVFGLILHYILSSQKHPFTPADCKDKDGKEKSANIIDLEIQHNIVNNNMEGWNNFLSPEATHLVKQMLDSDGTQRPSAADALNHPMFWSNKKKMDFLSAVEYSVGL